MRKRVDSASRLVPAAPDTVYAALAEPAAVEQWMAPNGMRAKLLRFAFHEGGGYRMRLTYNKSGTGHAKSTEDSDEVTVRFVRIEKARRIEQEVTFTSADPAFAGVMRMTWTLEAADAGTLVSICAEDVPSGISPVDHEAGMASTLDNLATYLGRA